MKPDPEEVGQMKVKLPLTTTPHGTEKVWISSSEGSMPI